jgi:hypothetical protein
MKKLISLCMLFSVLCGLHAQESFRLWQGGESTKVTLSSAGAMTFGNNGYTLTIAGTTYQTAAIDSIVAVHQVKVVYSGSSAQVTIPAALAADVTAQVTGAHVVLTNNNVSNEMEFVLSGSSTDGSFTYNGQYKTTLVLNGLTLTSGQGAAIDIQCGKRIGIVLQDGTTNTLSDYAQGTQKACLNCKGHIEFEGAGTLNVTGNLSHAIKSKEYLQLKKSTGTINILSAVGDAIHTGQYYQQNGGTVNITSTTLGDGIQTEYLMLDDDITPDPDEEFNGQIFIKGGNLNIEVSHEDCKAIKADDLITISGGTFQITASGNGSRGIQTDGSVIIGEEDNNTSITIVAKGGLCTNEDHEDDPHRCMGMKIDGGLTVNAGVITVTNTGTKSRGIKCTTYTKNGGTVTANLKIG